eukprot:scaffold1063_cov318-Pavlova_lutheri.AAC.7
MKLAKGSFWRRGGLLVELAGFNTAAVCLRSRFTTVPGEGSRLLSHSLNDHEGRPLPLRSRIPGADFLLPTNAVDTGFGTAYNAVPRPVEPVGTAIWNGLCARRCTWNAPPGIWNVATVVARDEVFQNRTWPPKACWKAQQGRELGI